MSQISSALQLSEQSSNRAPKTKQQYSRNVKKLKIKLKHISDLILTLQQKIKIFENTSNDKMIALKISKFCRQRKITPQMLFRFADRNSKQIITKHALHQTMHMLGLKLSQNQLKRFQYLLDQDLSGQITWEQYNHFLYAFGVKAEYSANDNFLKDALKKLDIGKILGIAQQQKKKKKGDTSYRQLLNYQQFTKYCHRHFPQMKNKQIASIFNRLQKNGFIDLQDFLQYLKRKQQQQKQLQDKNKLKRKTTKQDNNVDQSKTLKGIIKVLLKHRPKDRKLVFHSSEFQRLQKILDKKRGQFVTLFRQIDKKKKGSFGFNILIQYFINRCLKQNMVYAYELMGRKTCLSKQKPQDTIRQYNQNSNTMTNKQFIKYCVGQYQLTEVQSENIWKALVKQDNKVPIRVIIDAMKLDQGQKKVVYIKPTLWDTKSKDFFKKGCFTIYFNPLVALRGCISIMEQLNKQKQHFWDDFQFGPTFQDPSGIYSIGMNLQEDSVKWVTSTSLQMDDFYFPTSDNIYKSSPICSHQMLPKALKLLSEQGQFLWTKKKIDYNIKNVTQDDLKPLFSGVYPLIFHSFAKYGIYVFKFYVKEKWVYVLIDNKIPCNSEGDPLFSTSFNKKLSWISLIQKAYAKVKGTYERAFQPATIQHYIYQFSRTIPLQQQIDYPLKTQQQKNTIWKKITEPGKNRLYACTTDSEIKRLVQNNVQTGFIKNYLYQIGQTLQLPDQKCNNEHKSHRLILFKSLKLKNQQIWNPQWQTGEQRNKFDEFQIAITNSLKSKKSGFQIEKQNQFLILNYKLFRSIFNKLFSIKNVSFDDMIILRKILDFQEKHICKYEINSSNKKQNTPLTFFITLNRVKSPLDTEIIVKLKNQKDQIAYEKKIRNNFGTQQFIVDSHPYKLEISVANWASGQDHAYCFTMYILNPKYHLRELDRQMLFHHVSPYEEAQKLDIDKCGDKQRKFIYRNFYRAADRGTGCCC